MGIWPLTREKGSPLHSKPRSHVVFSMYDLASQHHWKKSRESEEWSEKWASFLSNSLPPQMQPRCQFGSFPELLDGTKLCEVPVVCVQLKTGWQHRCGRLILVPFMQKEHQNLGCVSSSGESRWTWPTLLCIMCFRAHFHRRLEWVTY